MSEQRLFERILVAVDGSPRSEKTITIALDMAQRYGSTVTVVHVREYERYEGSDVDMGPPIPAEQLVDGVLATFRSGGVDATGRSVGWGREAPPSRSSRSPKVPRRT